MAASAGAAVAALRPAVPLELKNLSEMGRLDRHQRKKPRRFSRAVRERSGEGIQPSNPGAARACQF